MERNKEVAFFFYSTLVFFSFTVEWRGWAGFLVYKHDRVEYNHHHNKSLYMDVDLQTRHKLYTAAQLRREQRGRRREEKEGGASRPLRRLSLLTVLPVHLVSRLLGRSFSVVVAGVL